MYRSHRTCIGKQIDQIAKSASKKLGLLFRFCKYFVSEQLFKLYIAIIRLCLEYYSHIWVGSNSTSILDRIESKAIHFINNEDLIDTLDPLPLRQKVASLSLFYRYWFGHCSSELSDSVLSPYQVLLHLPGCSFPLM